MFVDNLVQTLEHCKQGEIAIRWSKTKCCRKIADKWGQFLAEAYPILGNVFHLYPQSEMLVLSQGDWMNASYLSGNPYGNPVCPDDLIVVGCGAPDSWKKWAKKLLNHAKDQDLQELLQFFKVHSVDEAISRYFTDDLFKGWLIHELAHHFSNKFLTSISKWKLLLLSLLKGGPSRFMKEAMWIGEFIPTYCMVTFLKEYYTEMAKAYSMFLSACFKAGHHTVQWPKLRNWGYHYDKLVKTQPETILWYHAKCYLISEQIHDELGHDFLNDLSKEYPKNPRTAIKNLTLKVKQIENTLDSTLSC